MKSGKKTIVLGASPNPSRFSYKAVLRLQKFGHEVIPIGLRKGSIDGIEIITEKNQYHNIHTITLYLNANNQKDYYDYILTSKPQRIIFNPGTENFELAELAKKNNIEVVEMCTLVMLSMGIY